MANTAENKAHGPVVPFRKTATPESRHREQLVRDLGHRCIELSHLKDNWDNEDGVPPTEAVVKRAFEFGYLLIGTMEPMPASLSISASSDGHILFSLFGSDGREADVWIEDDSGVFSYVATERGGEHEGQLPIANVMRLGEWLLGRMSL